jgi:hypothetical protein
MLGLIRRDPDGLEETLYATDHVVGAERVEHIEGMVGAGYLDIADGIG